MRISLASWLVLIALGAIPLFAAAQDGASPPSLPGRLTYTQPTFFLSSDGFGNLTGEITPKTLEEAKIVIPTLSKGMDVRLDSPGGDVISAIEIGRLLRANRVGVIVPQGAICASACVLVFAGAVHRYPGGPVIIHRPYFTTGAAARSYMDAQKQFNALRETVRNYLQTMNVSPALWDAMVSISPSDARTLTDEERDKYGLLTDDPVEDELDRQANAKRLGISVEEYMRRQVLQEQICQEPRSRGDNHPSDEEMKTYARCVGRVMSGGN